MTDFVDNFKLWLFSESNNYDNTNINVQKMAK